MAQYTPPLRDMQFVLHEVLKVTDDYKHLPQHAEVDADTINAVLEEAGKFAAEVIRPPAMSTLKALVMVETFLNVETTPVPLVLVGSRSMRSDSMS
jgi:hypothetical protein